MPGIKDGLELLGVHRRTAFTFDGQGRMAFESAPDRSRGRRFSFTGCRGGNLGVIRDDVPDNDADELEQLLAEEPPFVGSSAVPRNLAAYLDVLGAEPDGACLGLLWSVPVSLPTPADVDLVFSGTAEADDLVARFGEVSPTSLTEAFGTPSDMWAPWCVVVVGGQIASIAETVRIGTDGAEVGVDTAAPFRGRGLAAAATAGWSRHPALHDRALFYSTGRQNQSSRRVTERLDLPLIGSAFAVP